MALALAPRALESSRRGSATAPTAGCAAPREVIEAPVAHVHVGKELGPAPGTRFEPSTRLIGWRPLRTPLSTAHRTVASSPLAQPAAMARPSSGAPRHGPPRGRRRPPRGNVSPHPEHPPLLAHECHVDAVGHAKRVDRATPHEQAGQGARISPPRSQEAPQTRKRAAKHLEPDRAHAIARLGMRPSTRTHARLDVCPSSCGIGRLAHEPPPTSNVTTAQRARGPTLVLTSHPRAIPVHHDASLVMARAGSDAPTPAMEKEPGHGR